MKNTALYLISSFCLFIFCCTSCDTNCNDCGSYKTVSYFIENNSNQELELVFFRETQNVPSSLQIGNRLKLHQLSVVSQEGILCCEPFFYDSLQIKNRNSIIETFYNKNNSISACNDLKNPLCENNYELIRNDKDSKENEFLEYLITIE